MFKKKNSTVPNIWTSQENRIHLYRIAAAVLAAISGLLFILMLVFAFRDPLVVVKGNGAQEFYPAKRAKPQMEKSDIVAFTKDFLVALYVWPEFGSGRLVKEISPFAEEGLVSKVVEANLQKYGKDLKGKKLAQSITFIDVDVLADRVVCRFDRVLKIEGIPLVIPTEVTLSMIQGNSTRLNPLGIYVSGVTEHEGAR